MDAPSFGDLFRVGRDEMLARNAKLSRDAIEREGSDSNVMLAGGVAAADEVKGQLVRVAAGQFIDSARGDALKRLVFDRYGLTAKPAAPSLGSVNFTTTAPNPSAFSIPSGTSLSTSDGISFVTTSTETFPSSTTGPVVVAVRSLLAGADQQAKAGTITSIAGQISGQPADLAVANPLATAGAADEESEDSLRDRARRFFTTVRRGTLAALEEGALGVQGVKTASAIEVLDSSGRPGRLVLLTVTDQFTDALANLNAIPPTYQAQSQQLAQAVFQGLSDVRAAGIYVDVQVAQVKLLAIRLALTFFAGVTNLDPVAQAARAAIVNYVNGLPPGSPFSTSAAVDALRPITGLFISGGEIASPAGNVLVTPLQAVRTSLALVTAATAQGLPLQSSVSPDAFAGAP